MFRSLAHQLAGEAASLPVEGRLATFTGATSWLNSEPLTPEGLKGRVVLVDFWTYTCVNWLRTLPYVRAWARKYRDAGLTIIGVHTPEFGFEHDLDNVRASLRWFGVDWPIAVDSDYGVWRAFDNHYWPAVYLADAHGDLRYHHFGEGEYAMTEMAIQQLLAEAGAADLDLELVTVEPKGLEVSADWRVVQSGETYLGYGQTSGFANDDLAAYDRPHSYSPTQLRRNEWALTGNWTAARHAAVLNAAGGRVAFRFHARDLNLVMGPGVRGESVSFRVLLDGQPPSGAQGTDVAADGGGTLTDQRTYQLIRQAGPITDRTFEIEFGAPGVEAYCFTFG
jgi:thiol-disulfide isomerase/thioredoxin